MSAALLCWETVLLLKSVVFNVNIVFPVCGKFSPGATDLQLLDGVFIEMLYFD